MNRIIEYEYKPGIRFRRVWPGVWLLDQNPNTGSIFAEAVRKGNNIQWVLNKKPEAGKPLGYIDFVVLNGHLLEKNTAKKILHDAFEKNKYICRRPCHTQN